MHKNPAWLTLLSLVVCVALYYGCIAASDYYTYTKRTEQAPAAIEDWSIVNGSRGRFYVEVTFRIAPSSTSISERWNHAPFRNRWAAQEGIKKWREQPFLAHFDPAHPEEATLVHLFPWKSILKAGAFLAILLYFLGLGYYVGKRPEG